MYILCAMHILYGKYISSPGRGPAHRHSARKGGGGAERAAPEDVHGNIGGNVPPGRQPHGRVFRRTYFMH